MIRKKKNLKNNWDKNKVNDGRWIFAAAALFFALLSIFLAGHFLGKSPTGLASYTRQSTYSSSVNLEFHKSSQYVWNVEKSGNIQGIRLRGSKPKEGLAKVYIENENSKYLIFDSSKLVQKNNGIFGITGFAIKDEKETPIYINTTLEGELGNESKLIFNLLIEDINTTRNSVSIAIIARGGNVSKSTSGSPTYLQSYLVNNLSMILESLNENITISINSNFEEQGQPL